MQGGARLIEPERRVSPGSYPNVTLLLGLGLHPSSGAAGLGGLQLGRTQEGAGRNLQNLRQDGERLNVQSTTPRSIRWRCARSGRCLGKFSLIEAERPA